MTVTISDLHSHTSGSGVDLIMLHGWNRSGSDLQPLAELLTPYARTHLIDLPGFGSTKAPPEEGWDTSQYAELIAEYIASHTSGQVVLLGHSFGGRVSLRIAAAHPDKVLKIILIDSHGLKPIRSFYQQLRVASIRRAAKIVKLIDSIFNTRIFPDTFARRFGSADYQNAGVLKNTLVKTVSEDQTDDVCAISAEALLLWGSEDQETPVALAKRFHELIQRSKLIVMEGKGHSPFHGMGAHLCANYIIQFLENNGDNGAIHP